MLANNPKNLIPELLKIAEIAGEAILKVYAESAEVVFTKKDDNSPLTKADKAANDIICEGLEKLEVIYPIISEENKEVEYEERKSYSRYWLVDPLDGTKEFIKRNGEFTVNIALVENGESILGVVYAPVLKEMYYAVKDEGAYLINDIGKIKLNTLSYNRKEDGLGIICSRSHLNEATQSFIDDYQSPVLVSKGSSLKFLMLANAKAHIYPRVAPTMEWDTAAAQIILEEAGGKVVNFETGKPLRYNKENLLNPFFIATANELEIEENIH